MTCRRLNLCLFLVFTIFAAVQADNLELVSDADLEKLIANEKFVIALFRTGTSL